MGLMQKLSRKLSGTRAESGVRSSNSNGTTAAGGTRDGLQQMQQANSREPVRSTRDKYPSAENGRPHYARDPSTASSNISVPSQLCDVVVHCATVLPRTNTNTSSIHSNDMQQNGYDGGNTDNNFSSSQRNGHRDTIMPLHTDNNHNDSYRAGYEAGRLYKPQSVPSSLHSSRPNTGGNNHRGEGPYHTPPSALHNGHRSNSSMHLGHSHASAFNHAPNSWSHSGPSTDSSQVSQNRNTFRMESGAYDAGYRDALAQVQRSLG